MQVISEVCFVFPLFYMGGIIGQRAWMGMDFRNRPEESGSDDGTNGSGSEMIPDGNADAVSVVYLISQ